jgi:hypothetical protein
MFLRFGVRGFQPLYDEREVRQPRYAYLLLHSGQCHVWHQLRDVQAVQRCRQLHKPGGRLQRLRCGMPALRLWSMPGLQLHLLRHIRELLLPVRYVQVMHRIPSMYQLFLHRVFQLHRGVHAD